MHEVLQPDGWPRPRGYANGLSATGRLVVTAGQIGWTPDERWESDDLVDQCRQTFANVLAVLAAGDARAEHVVSLTWYLLDVAEYRARAAEIGAVYRECFGRHFPAMAAVQVAALVEPRAKVEIQAVAVVPAP
jgi:enamine deaminase RidA (YjgF/YER057c/UK114 family)